MGYCSVSLRHHLGWHSVHDPMDTDLSHPTPTSTLTNRAIRGDSISVVLKVGDAFWGRTLTLEQAQNIYPELLNLAKHLAFPDQSMLMPESSDMLKSAIK